MEGSATVLSPATGGAAEYATPFVWMKVGRSRCACMYVYIKAYDPLCIHIQLEKDGTTWKPLMKRDNARLEQAIRDGEPGPIVIENGRYQVKEVAARGKRERGL